MSEELERVSAILGLVVQQVGGSITITNEEITEGLPSDAGVRVTPTSEGGLVIELVTKS